MPSFDRRKIEASFEKAGVDYVVGLGKNARLLGLAKELIDQAAASYEQSGEKQRHFGRVSY